MRLSARVLPEGTVTFVLTDVEGSTRLWERSPAAMGEWIDAHDACIRRAVEASTGHFLKSRGEGDSTFSVFERAADAISCCVGLRAALAGACPDLRVRAVHTGEAHGTGGDYLGPAVNRTARLRAIAHGGQTLVSEAAAVLVAGALRDGARLCDLGVHDLKDLDRPERVFELRRGG